MKRILIVEDTEDNRRILRDLLSAAGYGIVEAPDGRRGVEVAQAELPDLILMDIQLPVMAPGKVAVITVATKQTCAVSGCTFITTYM